MTFFTIFIFLYVRLKCIFSLTYNLSKFTDVLLHSLQRVKSRIALARPLQFSSTLTGRDVIIDGTWWCHHRRRECWHWRQTSDHFPFLWLPIKHSFIHHPQLSFYPSLFNVFPLSHSLSPTRNRRNVRAVAVEFAREVSRLVSRGSQDEFNSTCN